MVIFPHRNSSNSATLPFERELMRYTAGCTELRGTTQARQTFELATLCDLAFGSYSSDETEGSYGYHRDQQCCGSMQHSRFGLCRKSKSSLF